MITLELIAAVLVGLAVVWLILQPLISSAPPRTPVYEPPDPEETAKGVALAALKEIEFDRETGKLSPTDAAALTATYRARAIDIIKAIEAEAGAAVTVREQILAEARARRAVETKVKHAKNKKAKKS